MALPCIALHCSHRKPPFTKSWRRWHVLIGQSASASSTSHCLSWLVPSLNPPRCCCCRCCFYRLLCSESKLLLKRSLTPSTKDRTCNITQLYSSVFIFVTRFADIAVLAVTSRPPSMSSLAPCSRRLYHRKRKPKLPTMSCWRCAARAASTACPATLAAASS